MSNAKLDDARVRLAELREAAGLPRIGRPEVNHPVTRQCEWCGSSFTRKAYGNDKLRFCGIACRNAARPNNGRPRKLPERSEVVRLYVEENLATTAIARMFGVTDPHTVRMQLLKAGVELRRKTVALFCKVAECGKPVVKIEHASLKTEYGTLCADHRNIHRRLLNRAQRRKERKIDPTQFNPWRFKEREEERTWLRNNRALLKEVQRTATGRATMLPTV